MSNTRGIAYTLAVSRDDDSDNMTSAGSSPCAVRTGGDMGSGGEKVQERWDGGSDSEEEEEEVQGMEQRDEHNEEAFGRYYGRTFVYLVRASCVFSVVSICMNTPKTLENFPFLWYVTLATDLVTMLVLMAEVFLKIRFKGFFNPHNSYLRSPGRLFELYIVLCIAVSVTLQCHQWRSHDLWTTYNWIVFIARAPRPLVLLRVLKSTFKLELPSDITYRSMSQIWGILLFLAYFLIIFALIGGQLFGVMKYFCVKNNKTLENITYSDFTIPIKRCPSTDMLVSGVSEKCPKGFKCTKLDFDGYRQNAEAFVNIVEGIITIYEAMSLEGWSSTMYECMELVALDIGGFIYFLLVFLLIGLLVRNVFIAIVTEAFADIRVQISQFTQVSSSSGRIVEDMTVLRKDYDSNIKLVHVEEALVKNKFRRILLQCTTSWPFLLCVHIAVFADAIIQSFLSSDDAIYGPFQILFTIIFDIEAILKILAMGMKHYRETCMLEGIISLGSTIFVPLVVIYKRKQYALFQVLRPFRLVLLWGSLRVFLRRILGNGKKITQLSLFTLSVVLIAAGIFLQLFCGFPLQNMSSGNSTGNGTYMFAHFPHAFQTAFEIFMQEGWVDVMDEMVVIAGRKFAVIVYVFIMLFHFLAATILVSVFVALILDNLELSEELKVVKQRRLGQEITDTKNVLPLRIRIFEWFKSQPRVLNMDHVEYNVPKIRLNFVTTYLESADSASGENQALISPNAYYLHQLLPTDSPGYYMRKRSSYASHCNNNIKNSLLRKQSSFTKLLHDAPLRRTHYSNSHGDSYSLHSVSSVYSKIMNRSNGSAGSSLREQFSGFSDHYNRAKSDIQITSFGSSQSDRTMRDVDTSMLRQQREEAEHKKTIQIENLRENHPKFDESLFIFSANSVFRKKVQGIVHARYRPDIQEDKSSELGAFSIERFKRRYIPTQTYLEWLMTVCTWLSLFAMIGEFSLNQQRLFHDKNTYTFLFVSVEFIFIVTSTMEISMKIIADGLVFAPEAFIRDFGDVLHFFVYIVSLIYVCWQPEVIQPYSGAYWLLIFRCFRPLRLITLNHPLRKEFWNVVRGYKEFFKVLIFLLIIMFIFASYGVQTFGGKLQKCNDPNIERREKCRGFFPMKLENPKLVKLNQASRDLSILVPRIWSNPRTFNFDNMGNALLALLEMLSLEGWTQVRDILKEVAPPWGHIYPHLYVFLACLIVLTLFIGIVVNNFNESKGTALLTVEQKRWEDLKKKLELTHPQKIPPKPKNSTKSYIYDILLAKTYHRLYSLLILVNVSTLFFGQWHPTEFSPNESLCLDIVGMICCFCFVVDTIAKLYTFSIKGYFMSWGNRSDFVLMLGGVIFILWSILSCHLGYAGHTWRHQCHNSKLIGVAIFILRFLTLSFKHNALQMLMLTILMGLYKSFYTFGVLVVIMMCYGFAGVIFFGSVKRGYNLNSKANFETFKNAFFLLTRIATGEDWNSLMHDAMIAPPYCRSEPTQYYWKSNCGHTIIAALYFHSYIFIITYILLNVFIAVIIENFSIFYSTDSDPIMSPQDIQAFQTEWNFVDDDYSGTVSIHRAQILLRLLYHKLGLDKPLMLKRMCLEIKKSQTGKTNNKVTFHNLLFIIAYKKIENPSKSLQLEERLAREELDNVILEEVAMDTIRSWAIRMCANHRTKRAKPNFRRRISGLSEGSTCSIDTNDGTEYDPLAPPRHFHLKRDSSIASPHIRSTSSSFEVPDGAYPGGVGGKKRRKSMDATKDIKSTEVYSWWDDEVEDGQE